VGGASFWWGGGEAGKGREPGPHPLRRLRPIKTFSPSSSSSHLSFDPANRIFCLIMFSVQYELSPAEMDALVDHGIEPELSGSASFGSGQRRARARARGAAGGLSAHRRGKHPDPSNNNLDDPELPPIFAKFATATPTFKPPTLVPVIPRAPKPAQVDLSSESEAQPTRTRTRRLSWMQTTPSPTIVTTLSPTAANPSESDDQPSDGPLFRALVTSLERRAQSLRSSLKALTKTLESSLAALEANNAAQAGVDEALESLSAASSGTLKSQVLGGLYAAGLGPQRGVAANQRQLELDGLSQLLNRLKASAERLKLQDQRRKEFESASKRYYDEISKVSLPSGVMSWPCHPPLAQALTLLVRV